MQDKIKTKEFLVIEQGIEELLLKEGFHLVDIEIQKGKNKIVSLFVFNHDSEKMGIESIAKLNDIVSPILENLDFLGENFLLEISSPGIFRKIKFIKEFNLFKGKKMHISRSSNSYIGICNGIEDGKVSLEIKNKDNTTKTETILIEDIKKATLC
jgi:ribosome maturation factor RimP